VKLAESYVCTLFWQTKIKQIKHAWNFTTIRNIRYVIDIQLIIA
jgi:hypothetical protein